MVNMAIKIEDASIKLIDKLYEIEKHCFRQEAFTKKQLASLLADYNSIGLAARLDGEIVGFALARVDIGRIVSVGHILTIDVAPAHRQKGIGQKLLCEIENALSKKGIKECRLEVREDNAAALKLYKKLGYKKVGNLENYYSDAHGLYLLKIMH